MVHVAGDGSAFGEQFYRKVENLYIHPKGPRTLQQFSQRLFQNNCCENPCLYKTVEKIFAVEKKGCSVYE